MKICHVITRMIVGGAQENTLLTVRGLREKGHDVTLLTGPTKGPEGKLFEYDDSLAGVNVVEEPALVRPLSPITDLRAWRRLRHFFRQERFDVVHTHSSKAGVLGRFAAWRVAPLVVHTVHGQPFNPYQNRFHNALYIAAERMAAKRCHHICTVAQAMIDQGLTAGIGRPEQYRVVHSGMVLEPYLEKRPKAAARLRRQWGIPESAPVIGKIARLFDLKGHQYLIAAAPEIVRRFPQVRFVLVGDGSLRGKLERMAAEYGVSEHFIFTGLVAPREIPDYIELIDGLVHLSLREGLPRSVVQAFAGGKPVAAFALDGTPEVVIPGKTGFLCAPGEVESVRQALLRLLEDPEQARQMGRAGRELVRDKFDWRRMVESLHELYQL